MRIERHAYGTTTDGEAVEVFALTADCGTLAKVITYGATLTWLETPDRHGRSDNIVLAHADLGGYEQGTHYLGATIGRYANRIAGGTFLLGDSWHDLTKNEGQNHLHGGSRGFDKRVWLAEPFEENDSVGVEFRYWSPDGEQGYPGNLEAHVTYRLTAGGDLHIDYSASTDRPTHVNLTNHSYFNLGGHDSGDILGHELVLQCDRYLAVDEALIPTGEILTVDGTVMDFREPRLIGSDIARQAGAKGDLYDVCMVASADRMAAAPVARLTDAVSGRRLELLTTQPAVQFYTANRLAGVRGVAGAGYERPQGLALEPQHFPDSPNQPAFPSTLLRPGDTYAEKTVYRLSVVY